jgi:hypothetical protein
MVRRIQKILGLALMSCVLSAASVSAQLTSPSYRVDETYFGTGGELDASSPSYKARQSAGELTVGNAASSNYQFNAGFNTTDEELLEVAVSGGVFDLGILDTTTISASSTTFTVRNYLASGYVVRLNGSAPQSPGGTYTFASLASPTAATPGTEQFGVNLRQNTTPTVGADLTQQPDNSFSFGEAMPDYDTPNLFKFLNNDAIARSLTSSGMTTYTLSFIANVSNNTPSGSYGASLFINVIPTF